MLCNIVRAPLANKAEDLGIQLGLELSEIKELSHKRVEVKEKLRDMLYAWCSSQKWSDKAEPLRLIIKALQSELLKQEALANDLKDKWKNCCCKLCDVSGSNYVFISTNFFFAVK